MLRKLHRWVGLALALPLVLQALTGILMVVIPLLINGRPQHHGPGVAQGVEMQIAAARAVAPAGTIPLRYDVPRWAGDSAMIGFGPEGEHHPHDLVLVDPITATVVGQTTRSAVMEFLHKLHTQLFFLPYGQTLMGVVGLLLFGMSFTGVLLWWPRPDLWVSGKWRKTVTISRRARGLRLWRESHISIGFWTALFLSFMALSGSLMAFPFGRTLMGVPAGGGPAKTSHHVEGGRAGALADPPMAGAGDTATQTGYDGVDHALERLHATLPAASLLAVQMGRKPGAEQFQVALPEYGLNRPATMRYGGTTDALVMVHDPATQAWGAWIFQWAHTLHEARLATPSWFAPVWKLLVFLSGVALAFFSISGVVMWTLRRRRPVSVKARVRQDAERVTEPV